MLQLCGYTPYVVSTGKEAISFLNNNNNKINLVLLDFIMPGISAEETDHTIHSIYPDLPIILMSGSENDEGIISLMSEGIKSFISKPFSIIELSEQIAEFI